MAKKKRTSNPRNNPVTKTRGPAALPGPGSPQASRISAEPSASKSPVPSASRPGSKPSNHSSPHGARRIASKAGFLAWSGFVLVLLTCIAWVLTHAYFIDTVTVRLCEKMDAGIPEEKRMPVFLSEIAFDG
ncbi:MAG: hypothetical protein WEB60_01360, partial [Terrimicrobiaceae bacterium]